MFIILSYIFICLIVSYIMIFIIWIGWWIFILLALIHSVVRKILNLFWTQWAWRLLLIVLLILLLVFFLLSLLHDNGIVYYLMWPIYMLASIFWWESWILQYAWLANIFILISLKTKSIRKKYIFALLWCFFSFIPLLEYTLLGMNRTFIEIQSDIVWISHLYWSFAFVTYMLYVLAYNHYHKLSPTLSDMKTQETILSDK